MFRHPARWKINKCTKFTCLVIMVMEDQFTCLVMEDQFTCLVVVRFLLEADHFVVYVLDICRFCLENEFLDITDYPNPYVHYQS